MRSFSFKSTVSLSLLAVLLAGLVMRLYQITANDFLFYDEGMYLGYNRSFVELVSANPPRSVQEFFIICGLMFKTALTTAKALWFFILNLRVFIVGPESWAFARVISALAGLGTVALTYLWANRYFKSQYIALLSAAILAVLPSHVFYSRLGMQESLSTLLFLGGLYLYVYSGRGLNIRTICSAVLLAAVFFTNYRMIIAPVFVLIAQVWMDRQNLKQFDIKKTAWFMFLFGLIVLGIGALDGGVNAYVNLRWMLNQAGEAHAHRSLINFLSFPYYLISLENIILGALFFGNIYFISRREVNRLLPFLFAMAQIILFSFAAEKGARYLCVILPFVAMSVAQLIEWLKEHYPKHDKLISLTIIVMFAGLLFQSFQLSKAQTSYSKAIEMVLAHDHQAKIISTQALVEGLFLPTSGNRIVSLPKDPVVFAHLLEEGYRYLIIDPQVYISWTANEQRFSPPLIDLVETIRAKFSPVAVLPHIEGPLLKRFVLDHNQDLDVSLEFLKNSEGKGRIYIYDLRP
jgi:hypothetical protein